MYSIVGGWGESACESIPSQTVGPPGGTNAARHSRFTKSHRVLNLERKAVLSGATSFKEEFSSYWRIFPGV